MAKDICAKWWLFLPAIGGRAVCTSGCSYVMGMWECCQNEDHHGLFP